MNDFIPTEIPGEAIDDISKVAEQTLASIPPPELEPFKISFSDYKEDKCKVDGMDPRNAQIAIKIVKNIGVDFKSQENFSLKYSSSKLEIKKVFNTSPYDEYYKKLPSEIQDNEEVKEIKYVDTRPGKESNLRIFFYTLSNIFYMLAITANAHENLDHRPYKESFNKKIKW